MRRNLSVRAGSACRIGAIAFVLVLSMPAVPEEVGETSARGDLDGMMFVGTIGPADGPRDRADTLSFGTGHFWSAICVPCGFLPSVYWVRRVGDEIHFRDEMGSGDRGRFHYIGVVRGKQLSATIHWRKERWYWSIDRGFRFEGQLAESAVTESLRAMTQRARLAAVQAEPNAVCPL